MKKWQKVLSEHHNVEIVDDNTVTVIGMIYEPGIGVVENDTVTRTNDKYTDSQGNSYNTIYEYLGY